MDDHIPTIDLGAPDIADRVIRACEISGFFAITGHGIRTELFTAIREALSTLFALDDAVKSEWMITPDNYRGFIPLGFFTPNRAEVTGSSSDWYEGFKVHWEASHEVAEATGCELYGPNRWPPEVPDLPGLISEYWAGCDALAATLLGVLAEALPIDADALRSWHDLPLTNMTLLHYPPSAAQSGVATTGIHPHKDTNTLTLLHPGPVRGLQVRNLDGSWIEPSPPPDALLVNIGEMLELWSGGRFVATPHRVINPTGAERYSFPWFLSPRHDITVEPLVPCVDGFDRPPMPVGHLSAEVWRTNWPDEVSADATYDLGSLDR